jgi:hypothetical protein
VGVQALRDGVAAEAAAGAGGKQRVGGASGAFGQPGLQQGLDWAADGDDALFASFAFAVDGRAGAEADVGAVEAGEFGDAQSGLDGWTKTFTDPRLCAAIVDRLTFGGNIIETGTDSYRLAQTRARNDQPTHTRV